MYTIQALWTAAHHGIGAKFVILNNGAYQLLRAQHPPVLEGPRACRRTRSRSRSTSATRTIQFDRARAGDGRRRASASRRREQIGPALDAALADDRPFLIDLVVRNDVPHDVARAKHARAGQS